MLENFEKSFSVSCIHVLLASCIYIYKALHKPLSDLDKLKRRNLCSRMEETDLHLHDFGPEKLHLREMRPHNAFSRDRPLHFRHALRVTVNVTVAVTLDSGRGRITVKLCHHQLTCDLQFRLSIMETIIYRA